MQQGRPPGRALGRRGRSSRAGSCPARPFQPHQRASRERSIPAPPRDAAELIRSSTLPGRRNEEDLPADAVPAIAGLALTSRILGFFTVFWPSSITSTQHRGPPVEGEGPGWRSPRKSASSAASSGRIGRKSGPPLRRFLRPPSSAASAVRATPEDAKPGAIKASFERGIRIGRASGVRERAGSDGSTRTTGPDEIDYTGELLCSPPARRSARSSRAIARQ